MEVTLEKEEFTERETQSINDIKIQFRNTRGQIGQIIKALTTRSREKI